MKTRRRQRSKGRWSSLADDLLVEIFERLPQSDRYHLQSICSQWRSFASRRGATIPCDVLHSSRVPHLMIPFLNFGNANHCTYFSFETDKFHQVEIPEAWKKIVCGSSQGYLVLLGRQDPFEICLFNPSNRNQIHLPPLSTFPGFSKTPEAHVCTSCKTQHSFSLEEKVGRLSICKAVLSSSPTPNCKVVLSASPTTNNYTAMAMFDPHCKTLAFCKPGDKRWRSLENIDHKQVEDIIHYQGQFYVLTKIFPRVLVIRNLDGPTPWAEEFLPPYRKSLPRLHVKYLVEVCGDLLLVVGGVSRNWNTRENLPKSFRIFQFNKNTQTWGRTSLGDYALFVGGNCSISVLVDDYPQCVAGRTYCTDELDFCISNLQGSLVTFPSLTASPIWVAPSLD